MYRTTELREALHLADDVGPDDVWSSMALWLGQWALRGSGQWALEEKATGMFVGRAGLHRPHRAGWPGLEVGWALDPGHWGKGYASEAGQRSLDYAFDDLGAERVCSVILPENHRSQAVATRLGLTKREARVLSHLPDAPHDIWWITAEEHRSGRTRSA